MPALARPGSEGAGRLGAQRRCAGHLRTTNPAHRHHASQRDRGRRHGSTLTSREQINAELLGICDEATGKWGIQVNRVELKAIDPPGSILEAIHRGRPDPQLLAYQYLQTLPKLASGDGNHTWLIPSELARALDAFASGCLDRRTEQTSTSGPAAPGEASGDAAGPPQIRPVVIP